MTWLLANFGVPLAAAVLLAMMAAEAWPPVYCRCISWRTMHAIKHRSQPSQGSGNAGDDVDPQGASPVRVGVEPTSTAPPTPSALVGAAYPSAPHAHHTAPTRLPLSSAGVGGPGTPVPAPAGLPRLGGAL
jgi:hypothetical protein